MMTLEIYNEGYLAFKDNSDNPYDIDSEENKT